MYNVLRTGFLVLMNSLKPRALETFIGRSLVALETRIKFKIVGKKTLRIQKNKI